MLDEVTVGKTYKSKGGYFFKVVGVGSHGQDCSISMVIYESVFTADTNGPKTWVIEESLFLQRMAEV